MKLTKLLLTAVAALGFITATAQTYSKIEIQVDTAKPVWNSIQKALSEQRLSVAERSSDRMLTSYVVWSNMLTQNRGRIAITLIGETLRIEMIDRQYSTGTAWSNAIGDLSKKNQEKYLLPLSSRVTELLSLQPAQPAQGNLTAQNSGPTSTITSNDAPIQGAPPTFSPSLCDNGICLEILQAKIIGQKLVIKGKMMSQSGNAEIGVSTHHLYMTTDKGEEYKLIDTRVGSKNSSVVFYFSFIEGLPVNSAFTFYSENIDVAFIQHFNFTGSNYLRKESPTFSLVIKNLPIPYNTDPSLTAKGEVEMLDGVYIRPIGWEKIGNNLRVNLEFINTSKENQHLSVSVHNSRAIDGEGNEYHFRDLKIGNTSSEFAFDYDIDPGIRMKGSIDIVDGKAITELPLLELKTSDNVIRLRNLHPIFK